MIGEKRKCSLPLLLKPIALAVSADHDTVIRGVMLFAEQVSSCTTRRTTFCDHSQSMQYSAVQTHSAGMQRSLEQEVGLGEGRLAAISLRSKCRKLESESLFAEVFEKYEVEIRQLQVTVRIIPTS